MKILMIVFFLSFLMVVDLSAMATEPEQHTIRCNPADDTCAALNQGGIPIYVPGEYSSSSTSLYTDFSNCPVGENHFTDIFVYDTGVTGSGNGTGYLDINGCYNNLTPGVIKFSTESTSTIVNDYTTWYNSAFSN